MQSPFLTIRAEQSGDEAGIYRVHNAAFSSPIEGQLVDELRHAGRLSISRVAVVGNEIVGHIAFSPVTIKSEVVGLGLAPLAVLPTFQRQKIGAKLIQDALTECVAVAARFVVVLGSPAYYGRFGFKPAAQWNLCDEYEGGEAFQVIELVAGSIPAEGGLVKYTSEFAIFAK